MSGKELNVSTDLGDSSDPIDFDGGVFEAVLPDGLEGRIELAVAAPSALAHIFNLLTVPLAGFAAPGLADARVWLNISVHLGIEMLKPATVSFGFDFALLQNASVLIDVADQHNSSVKGFKNEKQLNFKLLPVTISEPNLDVLITAALILDIAIGAQMLHNDLTANAGASIQIPKLNIAERHLINVDSRCNPLKNGTVEKLNVGRHLGVTSISQIDTSDAAGSAIRNYTNIITGVGVGVGVYV